MKQLLIAVLSVFMLAGCATKQPSKNEVATTNKTETTTSNKNKKPSKNKKPVEKVEENKVSSSNTNTPNKQAENKPELKPNVETKPTVESKPVNPQAQVQKPEEVKPTPQLETPKPQPQPAPQPEPEQPSQPIQPQEPEYNEEYYRAEAAELMGFINEYRVQNGLHPLKPLPALQAFADKRAQELITNFSHHSQYDIYAETGFKPSGENIAYGPTNVVIFNAWKQSPGHNYCMLEEASVYGAIGYARNEAGRDYWVLSTLTDIPSQGGWH